MTCKWKRYSVTALTAALFVLSPQWSAAQTRRSTQTNQTPQVSQTGQTGQSGQMDIAGQISGDERFLRDNRDPGQLVGGSTQGVGTLRGQTDPDSRAARAMFGNQGGFNPMNQFGGRFNEAAMFNAMPRQRQQLRIPLRLGPGGISPSPSPAVATGPNLRVQNHLARIPQLKNPGAVAVEMEGRIAVLRGEVPTQHERDLVARLVLLEPGIADVRNELTVSPATP